jgi:superkiller protein 3
VDLYSLVSLYVMEDGDLDSFAAGATFNTDSHPILEFRAPRFIYANTSDENHAALDAVSRKVPRPPLIDELIRTATPENYRHKGEMYLTSESYSNAIRELRLAVEANPDDAGSWKALLRASRSVRERPEVETFIEGLLASRPSTLVRLSAAEFYWQESNADKAVPLLQKVVADEAHNVQALQQLADIYADRGSVDLPETVDKLLKLDPDNSKGIFHLATIRFYQQRLDEAIQLVKRSLSLDPKNPRARNLLAIAYGQTFQHDLAEAEFQSSIKDFPEDWLSINNYGLYLLERGKIAEASEQFAKAVDLNPENVQAFVGLGEAARQSGRVKEAQRWYRIALQLDPNQPVAKQYSR